MLSAAEGAVPHPNGKSGFGALRAERHRIHHLSPEEALASLHTLHDGLTAAEAARRLSEFGANRIQSVRRTRLIVRFLREFTHFLALILWLAAVLCFIAEWKAPESGMLTLGLAIVGVILVNGIFSFWQEYRAERVFQSLQKLLPHQTLAVRDGRTVPVPAEALVPGDILLLEEGNVAPADCRIIEAHGLLVNNATLSGESISQPRDERPSPVEDLVDSRNTVLAGASIMTGETRAVVFETGMRTEFGRIAGLAQSTGENASPLMREISHVTRVVTLIAAALGLLFFLVARHGIHLSYSESSLFAIGIIVANIPEGLLPTVTLALAAGAQRMGRRNALIRRLPAVEALGCTTVICTDKTGTLTEGRMRVREIALGNQVIDAARPVASEWARAYQPLFETARLCQSLKKVRNGSSSEAWAGDPTEIALLEMAEKIAPSSSSFALVDELPFDSDRKRMSTLHETPAGLFLYSKGALEALLPLCDSVLIGGASAPLTEALKEELTGIQARMARRGLRVLALAHRKVPQAHDRTRLETGLVLSGLVGMEDPPRAEVPDAVKKCHGAGIRVIMITGDHPDTALAIAREIGLVRMTGSSVITGDSLRHLSDVQVQLALDRPEIIFARASAEQKIRIVRALKRKGEIVAVTGDGVNDAPALRGADIGIAMGRTGSDVARESADMVLLDDNFATIVAAIEEGRAIFENIRKFLTYILTSNVPELVPYLAFVLFKIPLPLTIIQILAVDLGTDMLPALGLGAEPPRPGVMEAPPRPRHERLMRPRLFARAYFFLGLIESAIAMAAFFHVLHHGGWSIGQTLAPGNPLYLLATTACLSGIVAAQVVNVFLCRSEHESVFRTGIRGNAPLLGGVIVEICLILAIDYTRPGQAIFGTAPLPLILWAFLLPLALGMLLLEEARKRLTRRGGPPSATTRHRPARMRLFRAPAHQELPHGRARGARAPGDRSTAL